MRISALLCITLCVSLYASEYKSRIVATQLRNIMRDDSSFDIETERGRFKIPKHNVNKNVKEKDNSLILKLLQNESHYLSLNRCSDDEYELRLEERLRGGGPIMGLGAYYLVKTGCYGAVAYGLWKAMRATGADQAMINEARRLMGELAERASEEAATAAAAGTASAGAGIYSNMQSETSDADNTYDYAYYWQNAANGSFNPFEPQANRYIDRSLLANMLDDIQQTHPRVASFLDGSIQSGFNSSIGLMGFGGGHAPVAFTMAQAGFENVMAHDENVGNMAEQFGRTFVPLANSSANAASQGTSDQILKAGMTALGATGIGQTALSQGIEKGGSKFGNTLWKYKENIKGFFKGIASSFVTTTASIEALAIGAQAFFTAMPGP